MIPFEKILTYTSHGKLVNPLRMTIAVTITTLCILIVVSSCSAVQVEKEEISMGNMARGVLSKLTEYNDPGIQYIVVDKTATIFEYNDGLSNIEKGDALSSSHTMAAFSMTKTLTAIAVLQLVEQSKINLNDYVSDYIKHPYSSDITMRHLLGHTSGIPNPVPLKWVHLASKHGSFDETLAFNKVLNENPDSDANPGTEYGYSNIGYWLLGKIIEKVSGNTYSDYVSKNIFEVLELSSNEIGFLIEDENNHAKGYLKKWSLMNIFGRFFIDGNVLGEYEDSWLRNAPNEPFREQIAFFYVQFAICGRHEQRLESLLGSGCRDGNELPDYGSVVSSTGKRDGWWRFAF